MPIHSVENFQVLFGITIKVRSKHKKVQTNAYLFWQVKVRVNILLKAQG